MIYLKLVIPDRNDGKPYEIFLGALVEYRLRPFQRKNASRAILLNPLMKGSMCNEPEERLTGY